MPSARDYRKTAARIKAVNDQLAASGDLGSITAQEALYELASGLADDYAASNPQFDRARFMAACGFAVAAGNVIPPVENDHAQLPEDTNNHDPNRNRLQPPAHLPNARRAIPARL